jgi:glycolate oxidase FAD binding subunit
MPATLDMARPRTLEEVQDLILEANATGSTVEVRGGGSKAGIGRPEPADLLLETRRLDAVIDYDPAELVLTAQAGASLAGLEKTLARNRQMLAFEPMDYGPLLGAPRGRATLGGVLAGNVSGPRRLTSGAARDHFLGLEAVSGRGDVFKAGGRVVKNVTGYDLPKLLGGSWGTLAVLTAVTVKVLPRPRAAATLVVEGLSDQAASSVMSACLGSPAPVTAAAHLPAGLAQSIEVLEGVDGSVTLLRLEGIEPSIRSGFEILRGLLRAGELLSFKKTETLWRDIRDVAPLVDWPGAVWRISAPPGDGWRVVEALRPLQGAAFYDWGGGLIWLGVPASVDASAPMVRRAAVETGGHALLVRASPEVRAKVDVFQPEPAGLAALSARVRAAFDPNRVLGPRHRLAGT